MAALTRPLLQPMPSLHDVLAALDEIALEGRDGCAAAAVDAARWRQADGGAGIWAAAAARPTRSPCSSRRPGARDRRGRGRARPPRAGHAPRLRRSGSRTAAFGHAARRARAGRARAHVGIPATKVSSERLPRREAVRPGSSASRSCASRARSRPAVACCGSSASTSSVGRQRAAPAAGARAGAGEGRLRPEDGVRNSAASHRPSHEWSAAWHRAWIRRAVREIRGAAAR